MMKDKVRFTKGGLLQEKQKLEELKEAFQKNELAMTEAFHNSSGDGAHDNAEFENLLMNERRLVNEINNLKRRIEESEIIEIPVLDEDYVNIDDEVTIVMNSESMEEDEFSIKLIGGSVSKLGESVSINSELGKAIFGKKVGETVSYTVNGNKFFVTIKSKNNIKGKTL